MRLVKGTAVVDDVNEFVASLGDVGDDHDCVVQAFDARYVTGRDHLETALRYAARAHRRDDAVARDPAVEVLLYAAGRRQIDRALEMGVDVGETPTVVLVASDFPEDPLAVDEADSTPSEAAAADAVTELLEDGTVVAADGNIDGAATDDNTTPDAATDYNTTGDAATIDSTMDGTETDVDRVREFFDVGDAELDATDASLADLVRERVVLLSIDH